MVEKFSKAHLQLGLFFQSILEKSSLFYLEFAITELVNNKNAYYIWNIYGSLAGTYDDPDKILEWQDQSEEQIILYQLNLDRLDYETISFNYYDFKSYMGKIFFELNDQSFLHYLLNSMPYQDQEDHTTTSYCKFRKTRLGQDISIFWGATARNGHLKNKLEQTFGLENDLKTQIQKI